MPISQAELLSKLEQGESLEGVEIGDVDFSILNTIPQVLNFRGAIFKEKTVFQGVSFKGLANFCGAEFHGREGADFSKAVFHSNEEVADFRKAKFLKGKADFKGVTFSDKGVDFSEALFSCDEGTNFSEAQFFGQKVAFTKAYFSGKEGISFNRAKFSGDVWTNFNGAQFSGEGGVDFMETQFSGNGKVSFWGAQFSGEGRVLFIEAKFSVTGGADFVNVKFLNSGGANFEGAQFSGQGGVSFGGAQFSGQGGVSFGLAQFTGAQGADFRECRFFGEGETNFRDALFFGNEGAFFAGAQFSSAGGVCFEAAKFNGDGGADFMRSQFSGENMADFSKVQFNGDGGANFTRANFSCDKGVDFTRAHFSGEGQFVFEETAFMQDIPIYFQKVIIKNPQNMRFVDVNNLGGFSFLYTDVENIVFKNVIFKKIKGRFFERELIADEIWNNVAKEKKNKVHYNSAHFHHVEIVYRQLKRNFEEQRDYARAGDFHYGEMEMKRKQRPRWRQVVSLIFLYKLFSGYGQRWFHCLIWFIGLALLFSFFNMFWIHPPKESLAQYEMGEPNSCLSSYEICPEVYWPQTFLFTLRVMTLNKSLNYEPKKAIWLGGFAVFLQYLIGPTVIALMVLAIRRKFRR